MKALGTGHYARLMLATLVLTALPSIAPAQMEGDVGLPRGSTPAAVTLEDLDGRAVDLDQWIGKKPVLLEFWARWCENCAALAPRMEHAHARYGDRVVFLAIAVGVNQSPRSIRRHLAQHPIPFPVLWDGNGSATRAYLAPTTSYVVVLDGAGRVAYTGVGPEQDIEATIEKVLKQTPSGGT